MENIFQQTERIRSAEMAVAGSILVDDKCLSAVRKEVTAGDFLYDDCKAVFEAACVLADAGRPVDPITVLGEKSELQYDFLLGAMEITPTARNAGEHAKIVAQEATRRYCVEMLSGAVEELSAGQDPAHVIGDVQREVGKVLEGQTRGDVVHVSDVVTDLLSKWMWGDGEYLSFLPTGYRKLDDVLGGGLIKEGLYVLAARPGCGKTTLALNIALQMLKAKKRVLFVSLEMSREQISTRLLSLLTGKPFAELASGRAFKDDSKVWDGITSKTGEIGAYKLDIYDQAGATTDRILLDAQAKQYDLVVIDYLGLLDQKNGNSRYEKITYTSGEIKRMARKLGIPVLCLAQLNREVESRNGGEPRLSDLRDSGSIEQDADAVLLLHSENREDAKDYEGTFTKVIVAKNRHGKTGKVDFTWYKNNGLFREY